VAQIKNSTLLIIAVWHLEKYILVWIFEISLENVLVYQKVWCILQTKPILYKYKTIIIHQSKKSNFKSVYENSECSFETTIMET